MVTKNNNPIRLSTPIHQKKMKHPTHDDASPSDSCSTDMERIFRLMQDERHLSALAMYHNVLGRLDEDDVKKNTTSSSASKSTANRLNLRDRFHKTKVSSNKEDHEKARELIEQNQESLQNLEVCRRKNNSVSSFFCENVLTLGAHISFPLSIEPLSFIRKSKTKFDHGR
jgi:hypothetical protein